MPRRALALGPAAAPSIQSGSLDHVIESYLQYFASGTGHTARAKRLDLKRFVEFLCDFRELCVREEIFTKSSRGSQRKSKVPP